MIKTLIRTRTKRYIVGIARVLLQTTPTPSSRPAQTKTKCKGCGRLSQNKKVYKYGFCSINAKCKNAMQLAYQKEMLKDPIRKEKYNAYQRKQARKRYAQAKA